MRFEVLSDMSLYFTLGEPSPSKKLKCVLVIQDFKKWANKENELFFLLVYSGEVSHGWGWDKLGDRFGAMLSP